MQSKTQIYCAFYVTCSAVSSAGCVPLFRALCFPAKKGKRKYNIRSGSPNMFSVIKTSALKD
jgi:hypothetical protein